MKIPHSVPRNVVEAYRCSAETQQLPQENDRSIRSEDDSWDEILIPDLKVLALRVLVLSWKENPLLEELPTCSDRNVLLETLPVDLPFELIISKIGDGYYWERLAKNRWEINDPNQHGNSWRRLYCERHLCEYLEHIEPSYFDGQREECEQILNLVKDYVHTIRVRSLLPTKPPKKEEDAEVTESLQEDDVHHIPFGSILPHLPHLTKIHLNFGVIYMDDGFEWRDFEFSIADCINLSEGLLACKNLKKFALTRSNLDQPRAAAILHGLAENDNLEELDFSYCNLADTGAHAVGEFLSIHRNLQILNLADNNIGPSGVGGLVCGLLKQSNSTLKHLNLSFNPLEDSGASHICALLLRNDSLKELNISGCGIEKDGAAALADVLSSGHIKTQVLTLDVSNNNFGENAGRIFDKALKTTLNVELDCRMCNFSNESEQSICRSVIRNRNMHKRERMKAVVGEAWSEYALTTGKMPQQPPEEDAVIALKKTPNQSDTGEIDEGEKTHPSNSTSK